MTTDTKNGNVPDDAIANLIAACEDIPVPYDFHGNPETEEWARFVAALNRVQGKTA